MRSRWTALAWISLLLGAATLQAGCGYLAAAGAGAAVATEAAEDDDDE